MPAPVVLQVHIPGEPVAKGRPRFNGKTGRTYTPKRSASAENYARMEMARQCGQPMLKGPIELDIMVVLPIPVGWSKKRQAAARAGIERPTKRPDADNYAKLYGDAGNGVLWHDDSQICGLSVAKTYGDKPCVIITVKATADALPAQP